MTWFVSDTYLTVTVLAIFAGLEYLGLRTAYRRTRRHPLATTLQAGLSPLNRGAAGRTSGVQPQPAPARTPAGAGPKHRATTVPLLTEKLPDCGGPGRTSADASDPPDLASTGFHPAPGPETDTGLAVGAPAVGAGAPTRGVA